MPARADRQSGFLLVGVVMFVLALTILGLSLYSLSSYEADFQAQSSDANAAYYRAQGGLALVQAVLAAPPYRLETAASVVPYQNVTSVVAEQHRNDGTVATSGSINWNDTLTVTVTAKVRQAVRTLQATYLPSPREDYYKRLFTVSGSTVSMSPSGSTLLASGSIFAEIDNQPFDNGQHNRRNDTVWLGDTCHVWQESTDSTWIGNVTWNKRRALRIGNVPAPDAAGYYAGHPTAYPPTLVSGGGGGGEGGGEGGGGSGLLYHFDRHAAGTVGYYRTPSTPGEFSFLSLADLELDVLGTAVWELPLGFRSEGEVTIRKIGTGAATLVIVGSPNPLRTNPNYDPLVGLWFFGGLDVPDNVTVILVSDGQVTIERSNNPTGSEQALRLSIYANALYLMGPQLGTRSSYDHAPDMDASGGVIDYLESVNALPRPAGFVPNQFTLIPGSWRDLTP